MRSIALIAFLALPVHAQAPDTRRIHFQCDEENCQLSKADWRWMMEQHMKAQQLLAKCGWKES